MQKMTQVCAGVALLCLGSVGAFADIVIAPADASAGFSTWTASTLAGANALNGIPFWDHSSLDADANRGVVGVDQCNIGYWMLGAQSGCSSVAPGSAISSPGNWNYLSADGANLSTSAVSGFHFSNTGIQSNYAALEVEVAGLSGSNSFGWFDASLPFGGANEHLLFPGSDNPGAGPVVFTPTATYGFYLRRGDGAVFLTTDNQLGGLDAAGHFALFAHRSTAITSLTGVDAFWLAVEDMTAGEASDFDFNDFVAHVEEVPEPSFVALLGAGMAGLFLARKRRNKANA